MICRYVLGMSIRRERLRDALFALGAAAGLASCTGSTGTFFAVGGPTPTSNPSASPSPGQTPQGPVVTAPSSLTFTAAGSPNAANFGVSETGYSGSWTESDTCSGIATVASSGANTYTVTPVAAGSCIITITDAFSQKGTVNISVTTSSGVISTRGGK